jgi:hypothetical protein
MKRLVLLFLTPLFAVGCQLSSSAKDANGNGAVSGTNPDRPVGSASASVTSPNDTGAVAGTPNSTTHPSPQP